MLRNVTENIDDFRDGNKGMKWKEILNIVFASLLLADGVVVVGGP